MEYFGANRAQVASLFWLVLNSQLLLDDSHISFPLSWCIPAEITDSKYGFKACAAARIGSSGYKVGPVFADCESSFRQILIAILASISDKANYNCDVSKKFFQPDVPQDMDSRCSCSQRTSSGEFFRIRTVCKLQRNGSPFLSGDRTQTFLFRFSLCCLRTWFWLDSHVVLG